MPATTGVAIDVPPAEAVACPWVAEIGAENILPDGNGVYLWSSHGGKVRTSREPVDAADPNDAGNSSLESHVEASGCGLPFPAGRTTMIPAKMASWIACGARGRSSTIPWTWR